MTDHLCSGIYIWAGGQLSFFLLLLPLVQQTVAKAGKTNSLRKTTNIDLSLGKQNVKSTTQLYSIQLNSNNFTQLQLPLMNSTLLNKT